MEILSCIHSSIYQFNHVINIKSIVTVNGVIVFVMNESKDAEDTIGAINSAI